MERQKVRRNQIVFQSGNYENDILNKSRLKVVKRLKSKTIFRKSDFLIVIGS